MLAAVGRGELSSTDVMKAVFPDYKDERVTASAEAARGGLVRTCATPPACCSRFRGARRARSQDQRRQERRAADPRRARRPAGALRAGRRGAGRPHRRHHAAGLRHHHLSDPVAVADGLRRPAGALDRRALGHRRAQQGALSGARLGDRDQRAGLARRDRAGRRRQRRQHPYAVDGAHRARLHRNADRSRSLGSEAPQPTVVAIQGEFERQRCAAG